MLLDCPGCVRSYHVSDADLGRRGRTVICPRCDARWYQDRGGTIGFRNERWLEGRTTRPDTASALDEEAAPSPSFRFIPSRRAAVWAGATLSTLLLAAAILGRVTVVAHVPRAAALYARAGLAVDVTGLAFARVDPQRLPSTDVLIRGTLRNVAGRRVRIPRLAFEVRDASGAALVSWNESVPARTLAAGRLIDFASQPHHLPANSATVLVRLD